ncbi:MAG: FAD-dependent oxidoreductase [Thiotrichaceae bacterium]|nr:FAD-dependent oxidoreductase [Thiotrichaceae bacterium]
MHKIVVLGSSFAALTAIKTLRKQGWKEPIILIAPRPVIFYYPSLIWVPAGLRNEQDLTIELEDFFDRNDVEYHRGKVSGLELENRQILLETGDKIHFDSLIVGSGGRFIKKLQGMEHIYTPCEGYEATKAYSDRLNKLDSGTLAFGFSANPKEPTAVRGGPMFEFLFGIDTLLRKQKRRDQFKMVFFNPSTSPGQRLGEKAVKALLKEMDKRGIETHLGHKMKSFTEDKVITEGGEIHSDLTLFMPGMTGAAWADKSGLPLSEGGFIQANQHCKVEGFEQIYVAGDSGSYPGPDWIPKQAHIADLQAEAAAKNLLAEIKGEPITKTFKSELVCMVDTLNGGMLVYRDPKRMILMPRTILFHWAKRWFEGYYLKAYR